MIAARVNDEGPRAAVGLILAGEHAGSGAFRSLAGAFRRWDATHTADSLDEFASAIDSSGADVSGMEFEVHPPAEELHDVSCALVEMGLPDAAAIVAEGVAACR